MDTRPKTIFLDIDGTICEHDDEVHAGGKRMTLLPGVLDRLHEWHSKGYNIIITTGRDEIKRPMTEKQLVEAGIVYDVLLMGLGGGVRVLINDSKPDGEITAKAYSLVRNTGLEAVNE